MVVMSDKHGIRPLRNQAGFSNEHPAEVTVCDGRMPFILTNFDNLRQSVKDRR